VKDHTLANAHGEVRRHVDAKRDTANIDYDISLFNVKNLTFQACNHERILFLSVSDVKR
jgi:hypothetical protein